MNRTSSSFRFRRTTAATAILQLLLASVVFAKSSNPPNVVFFHSDDHGWADVGFRGSIIDTPTLDAIAARGVTLERYHTQPICGPTRVGLMTGRNPIRMGLTGNISEGEDGVPLDEHMLPESFKAAGYQTWMMGKWHLGGTTSDDYLPHHRGFDHFYGFVGGSINETTHEANGTLDWQRNGTDVPEDDGQLSTDLMATEAISLIENRDPDQPFFLYIAFHALHTPYDAPQALKDKYQALGLGGQTLQYSAMAENMDTNIGRVLDAIEAAGLTSNTIVVFASDNGADEGKGGSNLPLRGWKGEIFEGGNRTPAAISWPGVLPEGAASLQFVSHQDWLPTLAAAAGISTGNRKALDGINRWNALLTGEAGEPHGYVIERAQGTSVLDGTWKLLRETNSGDFQLYDVYADPNEMTDLAGSYPEVVNQLAAYIDLIAMDADADFIADDADPCTVLSGIDPPSSPPDQNPAKLRLAMTGLDNEAGKQNIGITGYFNPATLEPALDPVTDGVHLRLADENGEMYDISIPGGLAGASPCGDREGWSVKTTSTSTTWTYFNRSGGLAAGDTCIAGAAKGVSRIVIYDKTAKPQESFQVRVRIRGATLSATPATTPSEIRVDIGLAAEATAGVATDRAMAGQCVEFVVSGSPLPTTSPAPYCRARLRNDLLSSLRCRGA